MKSLIVLALLGQPMVVLATPARCGTAIRDWKAAPSLSSAKACVEACKDLPADLLVIRKKSSACTSDLARRRAALAKPRAVQPVEVDLDDAKQFEQKRNWTAARRVYDDYIKRYRKTEPRRLVEAHLRKGKAYQREGGRDARQNATKEFNNCLRAFRNLPEVARTGRKKDQLEVRRAAAEAHFLIGEYVYGDFESIEVRFPESVLRKSLVRKAKFLEDSNRIYFEVLDYKVHDVSAGALFRIAESFYLFAKGLLDLPLPENLTEEEKILYRVELDDKATPLLEKAIEALDRTLRLAHENYVYNEWTQRTAALLAELSPEKFPVLDDAAVNTDWEVPVEPTPGVEDEVAEAIDLGLAFLRHKQWTSAESAFKEALSYDDKSAPAYNNLGLAYYARDMVPLAVNAFEAAIALNPALKEARLNLGSIYLDFLDYKAALLQFQAVRKRFPEHYQAMVGEANSLYGTGAYSEAASLYIASLMVRPNSTEVLRRLGKLHEEHLNKPKEALAFYEKYRDVAKLPVGHPIHQKIEFLKQMDDMRISPIEPERR